MSSPWDEAKSEVLCAAGKLKILWQQKSVALAKFVEIQTNIRKSKLVFLGEGDPILRFKWDSKVYYNKTVNIYLFTGRLTVYFIVRLKERVPVVLCETKSARPNWHPDIRQRHAVDPTQECVTGRNPALPPLSVE